MEIVLITLAAAGLVGCFGATLGLNLAGRGDAGRRRLVRPSRTSVRLEQA